MIHVCTITLPIRTQSEANMREHWRVKAKRVKEQRTTAFMCMNGECGDPMIVANHKRTRITLTRIAPRMLDSDNCAGSCKAIRDGIADYFCVDDGHERYDWRYAQRKGKGYAVEVKIEVSKAKQPKE